MRGGKRLLMTVAITPLQECLDLFDRKFPELAGDCRGALAAARALILAALSRQRSGPLLCLTASSSEAERLVDDLAELMPEDGPDVRLFPESEMSVFDQGESDPDRLRVLHELIRQRPLLVVASLLAFLQPVPAPKRLRRRVLSVGDKLDGGRLVETLLAWEYRQADLVEAPGDLALRSSIVDVYPSNGAPLRLELSDGELVSMRTFSVETQLSQADIESFEVLPMVEPEGQEALLDYFDQRSCLVLVEPDELKARLQEMAAAADSGWRFSAYQDVEILADEQPDDWKQLLEMLSGRPCLELREAAGEQALPPFEAMPPFETLASFADWARSRQNQGPLVVVTQHPRRLLRILSRHQAAGVGVMDGTLSCGFRVTGLFDVVTDRELFGITLRHRHLAPPPEATSEQDLREGELVVHAERGLGRFLGLTPVELEGGKRDLIKLEYANEQTLFVPPEQIGSLHPYRSTDRQGEPALSRLDTEAWQKTLARARASVQATVEELRQQRARRKRRKASSMGPDTPRQEELEAAFPYDETPSQLAAMGDIKADLERTTAMDRLLCGDVGYGKTEVAIRAAFKTVEGGFQAALLAPTTVLAQQHYESFRARMEPLGVPVHGLWSGAERPEETLEGLAEGSARMVVGTHSLLSEGVAFRQLGLLIVDEEQSFGVEHKERLRKLSRGVHLLSMSATPIPRTMQLALSGVRDISLLDAPPEARRPIRTYLLVEQKKLVAAALMRELERGGQAFVLHNRVEELPLLAATIVKLVEGARVAVAHGQMESGVLETVLQEFEQRRHDVLVCSTIIEAGIDFPNVNTIVIKDAHRFGLAQLYQIRGRVGRAGRQAYCYLMVPKSEDLNEKARLRLQTISGMTGLGSGYTIALRDLQIRGAGDLLGGEQSGEMARVGYALYARILDEALTGKAEEEPWPARVGVDLPLDAHLPEAYIPPMSVRITLYRSLAELSTCSQVESLHQALRDRFGEPPQPVLNLLDLARVRILARQRGITAIRLGEKFGERFVECGGAPPLTLERAPKGPRLLPFLLEALSGERAGSGPDKTASP